MNTPAHAVISLALLGRRQSTKTKIAILIGSLLPDIPIFIFYFVEKIIRDTSERIIWSETYFLPSWQNFIDTFNSIPFIAIGFAMAIWRKSTIAMLFFASMFIHILGDLPLHHDDAHRHFFPLSDWRFESPISYWDPHHFGNIFSIVEIGIVIACCVCLYQGSNTSRTKAFISLIGVLYASYFVYAFTVWT